MTLSTQLARWLIPYTAEIRELVEATANSARSSNDDTHKPNFQHPPNRVHQAGGLPEAAEAHDGIQALSWAPSALQSIVRIVGGTAAGCHRDQLRLLEVVEVNGITVFLLLGPQGRICDQLWGAFTVQSMSPWITAQVNLEHILRLMHSGVVCNASNRQMHPTASSASWALPLCLTW